MKSAYGRKTPAPDYEMTCVEPGSPMGELMRRHGFAAQRVHGDDTTVPVLANGKTITGRLWTYVRDAEQAGVQVRALGDAEHSDVTRVAAERRDVLLNPV